MLGAGSRLSIVTTLADVLTIVGERWTLLVVREVALGVRRFDDLQAATGAPRAVLADRLRRLVDADVLAQRPYQNPGARPRQEYALSPAGTDLLPVLSALSDWGERHLGAGSLDVAYCHSGCGHRLTARLVCECGQQVEPGPDLVASVNRADL
jgi:DNA-binding HxlR family transcriptional regulator